VDTKVSRWKTKAPRKEKGALEIAGLVSGEKLPCDLKEICEVVMLFAGGDKREKDT